MGGTNTSSRQTGVIKQCFAAIYQGVTDSAYGIIGARL